MATDQLFELLTLDSSDTNAVDEQPKVKPIARPSVAGPTEEIVDEHKWNLEQLWDESQYDDAFDVGAFLAQIDPSNQRT